MKTQTAIDDPSTNWLKADLINQKDQQQLRTWAKFFTGN
jgi:hypothetical protein